MTQIDYKARKKSRELEIVKTVYPDAEKYIWLVEQEQPDFLMNSLLKSFAFGVEVTELYRNQSSARLKNIPGYVDSLVENGAYIYKI
jgi:hypothetical protein